MSKAKSENARIELARVGENAATSGTWLEPYVGSEVVLIYQPDGSVVMVMDDDIDEDAGDYLKYFEDR